MRFHRVTWVDPNWSDKGLTSSDIGHPCFVMGERQGAGRFDNPRHYFGLYLARQSYAAVAEVMGDFSVWTSAEITRPVNPNGAELVRCMAAIEVEGTIIDLDDPGTLERIGWKPSDVVGRDRGATQDHALELWGHSQKSGEVGLTWWSYWNPSFDVAMIWSAGPQSQFPAATVIEVEPLTPAHPAVITAAARLQRTIT